MRYSLSLLLPLLPLLTGCSADSNAAPPHATRTVDATTVQTAKTAVDASNEFAFRLLQNLTQEGSGENQFISPTSLSQALSLALNGAEGTTEQEIATTLGFAVPEETINQTNDALLALLVQPDKKVTLKLANAIWSDKNAAFQPAFVERCQTFYAAQARSLDFSQPSAAAAINQWTAENTQNKINEIVSPDALKGSSAVLTNAVYFNGKWAEQFNKKATQPDTFTPEAGKPISLPMMTKSATFGYLGTRSGSYPFEAIRLKYGEGKWAIYAFLPKSGVTINDLVSRFSGAQWKTWKAAFQEREMLVKVPRFKVEYEAKMKQPLSDLGMSGAFTDQANFRSMFEKGDHRIDEVIHKTTLEVNEEGTEAAAATAVLIKPTSAVIDPLAVILNRPFLCAIVHEESGAIVFLGAIRNPTPLNN